MSAAAATAAMAGVERVEPVYFSGRAGRLYGCHHPPARGPSRGAVVLCPPAGHEYARCHRALRQLAAQLARAGYHALRFDYSGTGDSAGEYADASLATWRQDTCDAIEECKRRSASAAVALVGLRLGALVALRASTRRTDVRSLALWNPVVDGAQMLREWRAAHRAFAAALGRGAGDPDGEVLGMPLAPAFVAELEAARGWDAELALEALTLERMLILEAAPGDADVARLAGRQLQRGRAVEVKRVDQPAIWRQEPLDAIVPLHALGALVEWVRAPA